MPNGTQDGSLSDEIFESRPQVSIHGLSVFDHLHFN